MKFFVKRLDQLLDLKSGRHLLLTRSRVLLSSFAVRANGHVKLSDLVSVLARSGYLNRTSPIEVEMTQGKGEMLDVESRKVRIILGHEEVSRLDTPLSGVGRSQEEIKLLVVATAGTLDQSFVNDATGGRVGHPTITVLDKEALDDSLVDNDNSNLRLCLSSVVKLLDGLLELGDLRVEHLLTLSITDTVSVDHKVGGELVAIVLGKDFDGRLD